MLCMCVSRVQITEGGVQITENCLENCLALVQEGSRSQKLPHRGPGGVQITENCLAGVQEGSRSQKIASQGVRGSRRGPDHRNCHTETATQGPRGVQITENCLTAGPRGVQITETTTQWCSRGPDHRNCLKEGGVHDFFANLHFCAYIRYRSHNFSTKKCDHRPRWLITFLGEEM